MYSNSIQDLGNFITWVESEEPDKNPSELKVLVKKILSMDIDFDECAEKIKGEHDLEKTVELLKEIINDFERR